MEYFVGIAGRQEGPWSEADVRRRIADGTIASGAPCWTAGWPDWRKIRDVLPDAFGLAPPPTPVPVAPPAGSVAAKPAPPVVAAPAATKHPELSSKAIWSAVLWIVPCLLGLPSIVLGHLARAEIRRSQGRLGGEGVALAGLVLGYLAFILSLVAIGIIWANRTIHVFTEYKPVPSASTMAAPSDTYDASQGKLRQIALALMNYGYRHGGKLPDSFEPVRDIFGGQAAAIMDLPFTEEVETDGYTIVPGVTTSRPLSTVIAFESRLRPDGKRAVAYLNGTVALVDGRKVP